MKRAVLREAALKRFWSSQVSIRTCLHDYRKKNRFKVKRSPSKVSQYLIIPRHMRICKRTSGE